MISNQTESLNTTYAPPVVQRYNPTYNPVGVFPNPKVSERSIQTPPVVASPATSDPFGSVVEQDEGFYRLRNAPIYQQDEEVAFGTMLEKAVGRARQSDASRQKRMFFGEEDDWTTVDSARPSSDIIRGYSAGKGRRW
jgi:hypothetical protein